MRIRRGGKYAGCAAALCLLAVLALCGCQKKQAALPPDFGGKKVLRVAVVQPGACLDVQRSDNPEVALIADEVAEGLFRFTDERLLEPALAEDFPEISEDGLEYRFVLKPGLCFSDGTALTAEDVRFSLTRLLSPETASPTATYFSMIDGAAEVQRGES
ncbi:ABC transporter substrate-binding protein, partial [Stomatobaculum longum]|uniref:ABC transporter substrate-binding protein n=1 Tax=Stomatobaculum longum TaxID=796942 RepID=UPI0028809E2D